jgi:hypothetical protein
VYQENPEAGIPGPDYEGAFQLGKSGNSPWGGADSVDGDVYAIFQMESSIRQTLFGLVPGQTYTISWSQRARINYGGFNDINFSYGDEDIYSKEIVSSPDWVTETGDFTAGDVDAILKIWTTNPLGGDCSTFIDNIVITKKI